MNLVLQYKLKKSLTMVKRKGKERKKSVKDTFLWQNQLFTKEFESIDGIHKDNIKLFKTDSRLKVLSRTTDVGIG